ncbi:MAG: hypothetical protein HC886_04075 [Leptolyngbyaceae cyanobacterium SM1_1_3]|nr:hypothetical protein [Leptolyngbyaceae cyanobacterium SM1_1_3]NJN03000.1 hypothetical protein [Leptolyngbyaceae cyanobacterium RM1_1_2]NJO08354.1 hypothetical protein [Leptolyngbyaceae cyanobacterium SL_1_1]
MANIQSESSSDKLVQQFRQLPVDDQLSILWQLFHQMEKAEAIATADQITPQTAQLFLQKLLQIDKPQRLAIVRDIVAKADTRFGRGYSGLDRNVQLAFWYELAQAIEQRKALAPPEDYALSERAEAVWRSLQTSSAQEKAEFAQTVILSMGSDVAELPVT